jgi:hypothetical protein
LAIQPTGQHGENNPDGRAIHDRVSLHHRVRVEPHGRSADSWDNTGEHADEGVPVSAVRQMEGTLQLERRSNSSKYPDVPPVTEIVLDGFPRRLKSKAVLPASPEKALLCDCHSCNSGSDTPPSTGRVAHRGSCAHRSLHGGRGTDHRWKPASSSCQRFGLP